MCQSPLSYSGTSLIPNVGTGGVSDLEQFYYGFNEALQVVVSN